MQVNAKQDKARDYVISTGVQHSVRDFVDKAAKFLDISLKWYGSGLDEYAVDQLGNTVVAVDPLYFRPSEVQTLLGIPHWLHLSLDGLNGCPLMTLCKKWLRVICY